VRPRHERRIRKRLRVLGDVALAVARLERQGYSLVDAIGAVVIDPARFQHDRAAAGRLLEIAEDGRAVRLLLDLFFAQEGKDEMYVTALTMEELNDARAVGPLIRALLEDDNPHRRHAAARALGWIRPAGRGAALALARCVADAGQPQAAREEAAESLAYAGRVETIDALISVLTDSDVRIRFWAVFGLGGSCRGEARAVRALESMLGDEDVPPGNWWSVGREALAMLGKLRFAGNPYVEKLAEEIRRISADPAVGEEERRWAECYDFGEPQSVPG
jgi:hypothetical protein